MTGYWEELERPGPDAIAVEGGELRAGSRVRLTPAPGADALDLFLACRTAVIESVECDIDGTVTVAVVLDDDPGRDLGFARRWDKCDHHRDQLHRGDRGSLRDHVRYHVHGRV